MLRERYSPEQEEKSQTENVAVLAEQEKQLLKENVAIWLKQTEKKTDCRTGEQESNNEQAKREKNEHTHK